MSARLTFWGGVGSVTGANFLLEAAGNPDAETGRGADSKRRLRLLVDCGLVQGSRFADIENHKDFPYEPSSIDFLLVTHAHIDHIGRIPKLVRDGFRGKILSTPETRALVQFMFEDALKLIEEECRQTGTLPLYEHADVAAALSLWGEIPYHERRELSADIDVYLKDAGHVLGSAMYEISVSSTSSLPRGEKRILGASQDLERSSADVKGVQLRYGGDESARRGSSEGKIIKIVFTGDLGNSPTPILRDTEPITDADYIVMESVYGDRNHEGAESRRERFRQVISETAKRKGTLIIPTFSLEKTQVLLYELHELEEKHQIPIMPVFLDSPLAIAITEVYRLMKDNWNDHALAETGDIFRFPRLKFTPHSEESKAILHAPVPKIILAGSGMSNGGRIMHHEANYLPSPQNTILFTGYQAAGSLGRQIQDGAKEVTIHGQKIPVRAHVESISGYSSHKDSDHLVEFIHTAASGNNNPDASEGRGADRKRRLKVFVCMGEPKSALFLVQRLRDYVGVDAVHPALGESVEL